MPGFYVQSSDGEEAAAATTEVTQPPDDVPVLPSIGPPQILQVCNTSL